MCWSGSCALTRFSQSTSYPLTALHIVGLIGILQLKAYCLSKQVLHVQLHTKSVQVTTPSSLIENYLRLGQSSRHLLFGQLSLQTEQLLSHSLPFNIEAGADNNPFMTGSLHLIQHLPHFACSQPLRFQNSPMCPWPQSKRCIAIIAAWFSLFSSEKTKCA